LGSGAPGLHAGRFVVVGGGSTGEGLDGARLAVLAALAVARAVRVTRVELAGRAVVVEAVLALPKLVRGITTTAPG